MKYIIKKNKIIRDKYTDYVFEAFDIQNQEETEIKIPINFSECKNFVWNIGVIYGGSGTGKTTLLKEFGEIKEHIFDENKPLISNFDFLEPNEACSLLSSIGLSSVPTWLRPFGLLSNGEQYRANLAYKIGSSKNNEVVLIDEYTSVVDRDVAKAMSYALQKYIRKNNKKIILASCHFDIMEWLLPDWTYSPLKGRVERHDCLRRDRPKIELSIFRCRYVAWKLFKQHHYLSHDLNKSASNYIILWKDKPIGFIAILPFPHGNIQNGYRISRIVILPDFQGLGIGSKLCTYIGSLYKKYEKIIYIKTSNPALWKYFENSNDWLLCSQVKKEHLNSINIEKNRIANDMGGFRNAITKSFKYIGEQINNDDNIVNLNVNIYKNISFNQLSLF